MRVRKKIGLSPWGGVQPYDDGSPFLGGQLFLILCLRLYADNSDSLFEALADGFTS